MYIRKKSIIGISLVCLLISGCGKQAASVNMDSVQTELAEITVPENTKIVGLGEASHGVSEYQQTKEDVFKALVANNNCRTFIIEGDFGGSLKVEQYIHGGDGTAEEAVGEIGFAIYRTREMADLVEWMREYNETAADGEDLHFYGMDMQRYDNNKEYLFQVLDAAAPELSEQYKDAFSPLTDENRLKLDSTALKQAENDAQTLLEEMDSKKDLIVSVAGQEAFDFSRECAQSIYECSKLTGSDNDYNTLRDGYMAQKVKWYVEQADGQMIFINGHNGHIGKVSASGYTCLGQLLEEQYGADYFSIGTDAQNTCFNSQQEDGFEEMKVENTNALTELTDKVNGNYYYLDLATVSEDKDWQSIVTEKQAMTGLNVSVSEMQLKVSTMYTQKIVPSETYNGVIIFHDVTPTTLLP